MKLRDRARAAVGFNAENRERWVAAAASRLPEGSRVLDVGAGRCPYRRYFAHCDYRTHDFGRYHGTEGGLMAETWQYGELDYISDITAIPVDNSSFDAILCTEVLEHVPDPPAALSEFARILRIGGRLLLSAPLGAGLHQQPFHYYGGFTPHFYTYFLARSGFQLRSITPNGGFFRLVLQETYRAAQIIEARRVYSRWSPLHWLARIGFGILVPLWFARLDDCEIVDEFTVGYHVEAVKTADSPSGV